MNRENHMDTDIKGTCLWVNREASFGEKYEEMVLNKQEIPGLIMFYETENMGDAYLVYLLEFRKNFIEKLEGKRMGCDQMESFIKSLVQVMNMVNEYLLDPSNLVLEMSYIYENETAWSYIYIPGYNEDFWTQMEKLSEEWLNYVDYGNEKAVLWAYSFYERVHGKGCSVEEMMNILNLQQESVRGTEEKVVVQQNDRMKKVDVPDVKKTHWWKRLKENVNQKIWKNREQQKEEISSFFQKENMLEDTCPILDFTEISNSANGKTFTLIPMGDNDASVIRLEKIPALIGRASDEVDVWFQDLRISRLHARIEENKGTIEIVDMNSANGTYRNDERLKPGEAYSLHAGDIIKLADLEFICQWCS